MPVVYVTVCTETQEEHCNCTSHTSMSCIRGSRIPTVRRMSQHPEWEDGAPQPVLSFGGQQTYLKIEPKRPRKSIMHEKYILAPAQSHVFSAVILLSDREYHIQDRYVRNTPAASICTAQPFTPKSTVVVVCHSGNNQSIATTTASNSTVRQTYNE